MNDGLQPRLQPFLVVTSQGDKNQAKGDMVYRAFHALSHPKTLDFQGLFDIPGDDNNKNSILDQMVKKD